MTTITFFNVSEDEDGLLRAALAAHPGWKTHMVREPLTPKNAALAGDSSVVSVFTGSRITPELLARLPALRLIATRSTGFDHIDIVATLQRSVLVSNVPTYGEITVAEYTLTLLLALIRRLAPTVQRCHQGNFSRHGLMGHDLHGKVLGLIGTGLIGARVARLAHAFGMRILAHDPAPDSALPHACDVTYLELDALLPQVDALSLHAPYCAATHHLLNDARLRAMKPGAALINTARGGLIDSSALAALHASGHFGGIALDCFEGEEVWLSTQTPLPDNFSSALLTQAFDNFNLQRGDNVILTPHNAFNSAEALERIASTTVESIAAFVAGHPVNLVRAPAC